MTYMTGLTLAVWVAMSSITLYGTWLFVRHFRSERSRAGASPELFPVSILKPLKGVEPGLRENLESFFRLEYPDFELLFSVADERDPAVKVVRELIEQYPSTRAYLAIGAVHVGPNPKVNNLVKTYQLAKNDVMLISDSNVRVDADYLTRLVPDLDESTGVVTGVVCGRAANGLGGELEATYMNTFYARWMILAAKAGFPTVIGKSMLFRRSAADRFGGIVNLNRYLAEDYMAGQAMMHLGLKIRHMTQPIPQIIGRYTLKDFWSRHIRWGRMRKVQAPLALFFEPLNGPLLSGLLGSWGFHKLFGVAPLPFLCAHLTAWFLCDLLLMICLKAELKPLTPVYWLLRELSWLPMHLHILSGNTVSWRGSKLRLLPGGTLAEPVTAPAVAGGRA